MEGHRRITVKVPSRDLQVAQQFTGKGISETVRIALRLQAEELVRRRNVDDTGTSRAKDRLRGK